MANVGDNETAYQGGDPIADRRRKLNQLRETMSVDPFGHRLDGLVDLATATAMFEPDLADDTRPTAAVSGRVVLHRDIGKLIFMTLRDHSGNLQVALSRKQVDEQSFNLAKLVDLGDIVVARGYVGNTRTGEVTIWVQGDTDDGPGFEMACKSLAPPPEKWKGLQNPELRYRKRYVDMIANPEVLQTFHARSLIIKKTRDFLGNPPTQFGPPFVEVETPMMQPVAGGAAARPFITHHNALNLRLFMRVAPELYLKRLLVGGMPRIFEINRNFRNEGIDHSHNPEFTMLELYQAFGDYRSMMDLTEHLLHTLAVEVGGDETLPFRGTSISYSLPFRRASYLDLFTEHNGFPAEDDERLRRRASELDIDVIDRDHDVVLSEVWDRTIESQLQSPTFVMDYPTSLCPLTKTRSDDPKIAERFELFIAGMELANAYTELNDPDVQEANFRAQVAGLDDEEATFRTMDHDFLESLRVGMPPAGGLGIGIDRVVMLLANASSIRDVILFPLMRPGSAAHEVEDSG